jgi:hypothetical protein
MKHEYKPFASFSSETKTKVKVMTDYIHEVLANSNEAVFQYLLKWNANAVKGNKNSSYLLYLKGLQGVGKSTLFMFLRNFVVGQKLCLETGSEPLKSRFNEILAGKLFVLFEEMETASVNDWMSINSRLKRYITSDVMTIEKKGVDSYTVENLNNYIINTNNEALRDEDGRRIFPLDLNSKYIKNTTYWNNIYSKCFNDEVGHAFYCFLVEIDTTKFNAQDFPLTQNKIDSFAKRLESYQLFLKDTYIVPKKDINSTPQQLFSEYCDYCSTRGLKSIGKYVLTSKLRELNIHYKNEGKQNNYSVSYQFLQELSDKVHWIHELDE